MGHWTFSRSTFPVAPQGDGLGSTILAVRHIGNSLLPPNNSHKSGMCANFFVFLLRYIKDTWADPAGNLPIAVTEFGFSEPFEVQKTLLQDILYDTIRMSYYHDYMEAILIALSEGINVAGCLAWSFVDNFEVGLS